MALDKWIDALKYSDLDSIKDRLDCVELIDFLEELKRSREFIDVYCEQNETISQCVECTLYERGLCVEKGLAKKCREREEQ
jgi:hypothetical protein